jgi:hypothetical protein
MQTSLLSVYDNCLMRYKDSGPENPADMPTKALSPPFFRRLLYTDEPCYCSAY